MKDGLDQQCKICRTTQQRKRYKERKQIVINHYGGKCECCKEDNIGFLTIDHINNDGNKESRRGVEFYRIIIKLGFPTTLRILCWNCNSGRHFNGGICPHITADK